MTTATIASINISYAYHRNTTTTTILENHIFWEAAFQCFLHKWLKHIFKKFSS